MMFDINALVLKSKQYLAQMLTFSNARFLLLAICLLFGFVSSAQTPNETLKSGINSYRTNVFNQLKNGNRDSVQLNYGYETYEAETRGFVMGPTVESTEHYLTLSEIEGIYLIQHNFDGILEIVRNNGFVFEKLGRREYLDPRTTTNSGIYRSYRFWDDSLFMQIGMLVLQEVDEIKEGITASSHSQEAKDFLNVFVDYEVVYLWDTWRWQFESEEEEVAYISNHMRLDSIAHQEAYAFIAKYQDSEFNSFINEFMLNEVKIKNWTVGMDPLYVGTLIPTGEMANYIKIPILYVSLGLRVYYKNAFINLMGGVTATGLKQDIYLDTLWTLGVTMLTGDLTLGYCFDIGENFTISPLIGVRSIANLGPKNDGKSTQFNSQVPWTFGMEFSFGGLSEPYNHINPNYFRGKIRDGIALKIMYQNPGYEQVLPQLSGGLWTATVGFNMAIFGAKFDKK
ncbi:MAG: hypothetical protein GQ574_18080 [Crocinitomix sp.]|nr:hypothetical protein [Crocinitomix sp.]